MKGGKSGDREIRREMLEASSKAVTPARKRGKSRWLTARK